MPASEAPYVSLRVESGSLNSCPIWVNGSCLTRTLAVKQAVFIQDRYRGSGEEYTRLGSGQHSTGLSDLSAPEPAHRLLISLSSDW